MIRELPGVPATTNPHWFSKKDRTQRLRGSPRWLHGAPRWLHGTPRWLRGAPNAAQKVPKGHPKGGATGERTTLQNTSFFPRFFNKNHLQNTRDGTHSDDVREERRSDHYRNRPKRTLELPEDQPGRSRDLQEAPRGPGNREPGPGTGGGPAV